uniref:Tail protein n=1 Tax=viral metagenome TaxID=1070528 RepID=A0A6H1ZHI0_9ZZZZ
MSNKVVVASRKSAVRHILKANTNTTALPDYLAVATSLPSNAVPTDDYGTAHLMFGGAGADAGRFNYQVWLWYPMIQTTNAGAEVYLPVLAAKGTAVMGASALPTWIESTGKFADTITETLGQVGTVVHSAANDGIASLDVGLRGAAFLEIKTDIVLGPTALDALAVFDETPSNLGDPEGGLPTAGTDDEGAETYADVVTAPGRMCRNIHISVENNGAIVSCDGGTTDHFYIPANTERAFTGLNISAAAVIQGKNLSAESNYTNLRISVW